MKMMPVVVLLREDRLAALHRLTDRVVADGALDLWAHVKAEHGWSNDAIVAGLVLSNALAIAAEGGAS